jgi:hypothetical protein
MKKLFFLSLLFVSLTTISNATIRRVGYNGIQLTGVDYATIDAAHTASVSGDTIQVYGTVYGIATITKKLVIIGFGNNFDVNTGLQAGNPSDPSYISGTLTFELGSDSSLLIGCRISNIYLSTSNISIQRSFINGYIYLRNDLRTINNCRVISCCLYSMQGFTTGTSSLGCTGILVSNSIVNYISFNATNISINHIIIIFYRHFFQNAFA